MSNYINSWRRTSVRSLLASALVPLAAGAGPVEDVEQNDTSDASGSADSLEWWIDRVPTPSQLTPSVDAPEISTPCVGIDNLVVLCHRHHQLSHQPGWNITGTGAELTVHHPDRSTETSRPPGVAPPGVVAPQAGTTGREPPDNNEPAPHTPTVGPTSTSLVPPEGSDRQP